jgi:hypothetical protein
MFSAHGLIFGGTEGARSSFHVLRYQTHFRRYRGHRVQFSCFVLLSPFSMVPWASDLFFMFCASGLIFGDTEGAESNLHVLRSLTCFRRTRDTWSSFQVLRNQSRFRRYRGRRVQFSCFALPDQFSEVKRAPVPLFMFCAPKLILGGTECIGFSFHVLRTRIVFGVTVGVRSSFYVLHSHTRFRRY